MKFLSHKKIISLSLIIVFIAQSILLFTNIPEVHADVPVNVQGVAQVKEVGQNLKENIKTSAATKSLQQKEVGGSGLLGKLSLDKFAWMAVDASIWKLTRSTVNWINSGFEGGPAYVTDFGGFLKDIADDEIGSFIEGSALAFLCDPLDIKFSLMLKYAVPFEKEVECTLSDVIDNIDDFINGDFGRGGWDGWMELTTKPKNNRYGAYLSSAAELEARIQFSQFEESKVIEFGSGFFSHKKCEELPPGFVGPPRCEIVTPGSVIEKRLNSALGSGQRRLEVADEINEILSAALGQMLKSIFGGLQDGLRGFSEGSSSRPSYIDSIREEDVVDLSGMKNDLIVGINEGVRKETDYKDIKQSTLNSVLASETLLGQLTSCYEDKIATANLSTSNKAIAQERIDSASTTIATQITPTKTLLENDVAASEQNLVTLNILRSDISDATTLSRIQVLVDDLLTLQGSGILNGDNIFIAQEEQGIVTAQMSALNAITQTQITECQAFPPPPIPIVQNP
jgi:hypothetical protein